MPKLPGLLKSVLSTLLLVFVLQGTGVLNAVSAHAQTFLLHTGLLNANPNEGEKVTFPFDFTLQTLQGELLPMDSLKGKVVFLNLWATWCGPCRAETPGIEKLYASIQHERIVFVMLAIDKKGDENKIRKYLADKGYTFPVYRPTYKGEDSFPDILKVPSIPTTFVIDTQGEVVYKKVGAANYNTKRFRNFLNELSAK